MKSEEALQYAKGGLEVYQRDYPELITQIEFQKLVIKALERQEKYKRHDLRKNPEDLPYEKVNGHGQVMYYWIGSDGCVWNDCGWFYIDNREDRPYFSRADEHLLIGDGYRNVIAWRYIEPLEEDDE